MNYRFFKLKYGKAFSGKSFSFILFFTILLAGPFAGMAQQTTFYKDPERLMKEAQQLYQQGLYADAQPLFRKTIDNIGYFQATNRQLALQDARYYYTVCAFKLDQPNAVSLAKNYIKEVSSAPRRELMNYQLGRYYFQQNEFRKAIPYYEQASINNLSNDEIARAKFELGYSYFNLKKFDKAEPLFKGVINIHNQYYVPANYYYGYISLYQKKYDQALTSFERVVNEDKYDLVVPYYIAEIYYYQNKPDKLLTYAQPYLKSGELYYDADLRHLVGQTYFEQKEYAKALPYLAAYEAQANELQKEDVYELAYCYYKTNELKKAISGFKQLSGTTDSLGQNSMYLLGDCYLKTGQKAEARHAFAFCARSNYNPKQQEISRFNYGKLSYELGYQDAALKTLQDFIADYPNSDYNEQAREILAHLFMNTNDYKNALAVVEDISEKTPSVREAYQRITFGRAIQLINDGDLAKADQLLNTSLQYPVNSQLQKLAYFWKGEMALRNGQPEAAINYTNRYLSGSRAPALGEANEQTAHYNLGYAFLKKKQYAQALQHFQAAQQVFGANGVTIANDARLRAADCYYMMKDYAKANELYNQSIASGEPGSDYALYQKGIISGINGNSAQKLSILNQLSQKYPKSTYSNEADYEIAATYMSEGQYRTAIPYLQKVIQDPENPNVAKAMLKLGLANFNLNNQQAAIDNYKKVVQKFPHSPQAQEALQSLRNIYVNNGQPDAYLNFLKSTGHAVNASVEDSITYAAGESSFGNSQYATAINQFNNYLSKFPQGRFTLKAHYYRAESAYEQKDYEQALKDYDYVLSQGNSLFNERAAAQASRISFYQNKDYQNALKYYQQLKGLSSSKENTLAALRGILRCHYELQQWPQVETSAHELLSTSNISTDDQIVCYFYLGRAAQAQQNCDEAITQYQTVARMTKSELGAEARYFIAQCKLAQNKLKEAETAAFDVIKSTPSYDYWVASAYILLGNVFWKENDYFNAKATLQSIVDHCEIPELVEQAKDVLSKVVAEEKSHSKIIDTSVETNKTTDSLNAISH